MLRFLNQKRLHLEKNDVFQVLRETDAWIFSDFLDKVIEHAKRLKTDVNDLLVEKNHVFRILSQKVQIMFSSFT